MLLIRELARVAASVLTFAVSSRRIWLLIAIVLAAVVALVGTTVTVVGPVAIYPFL